MFVRFAPYLFLLLSLCSCSKASQLLLYQKDTVHPYLVMEDGAAEVSGKLFLNLFKRATGKDIEENNHLPAIAGQPIIKLILDDSNKLGFEIKKEGNELTILGRYPADLNQAIYYFFNSYVFPKSNADDFLDIPKVDRILLPEIMDTANSASFAFDYREPYFPINQQLFFQQRFNTQTLESSWGLWGHQLGKFIQVTPAMYAIIDGIPNEEQFNFSSSALEVALMHSVKQSLDEDPLKRLFLIMPNDNALACECDACKKAGNTAGNAGPAIINLINKLAEKFPQAVFFTSDYLTSSTPPQKVMRENTGVMISTMDFPKGVQLENSKYEKEISQRFKKWASVTSNLYVWDYAVNFDNYNDAYPTLLIQQENLKFFKRQGVNGVFMQGNESGYAAFEYIKAIVYAKLFQNLETDIPSIIHQYFQHISAEKGEDLANYFIEINKRAFNNKHPLDIYGGIQQSVQKYLQHDLLNKFYADITIAIQNCNPIYQEQLFKLKLTVLFQLLELSRINGLAENGYGTYDQKTGKAVISHETQSRLSILKDLSDVVNIETFSESSANFHSYFDQWDALILKSPYSNLLYGNTLTVTSQMDEGYNNPQSLTDGAIGFNDYYNNWMICTQDNLQIEISITPEIRTAKQLTLSFLADKRHKLAFPSSISLVTTDGRTLIKQNISTSTEKLERKPFSFPIQLQESDKKLRLTINKQATLGFACDEIILIN